MPPTAKPSGELVFLAGIAGRPWVGMTIGVGEGEDEGDGSEGRGGGMRTG